MISEHQRFIREATFRNWIRSQFAHYRHTRTKGYMPCNANSTKPDHLVSCEAPKILNWTTRAEANWKNVTENDRMKNTDKIKGKLLTKTHLHLNIWQKWDEDLKNVDNIKWVSGMTIVDEFQSWLSPVSATSLLRSFQENLTVFEIISYDLSTLATVKIRNLISIVNNKIGVTTMRQNRKTYNNAVTVSISGFSRNNFRRRSSSDKKIKWFGFHLSTLLKKKALEDVDNYESFTRGIRNACERVYIFTSPLKCIPDAGRNCRYHLESHIITVKINVNVLCRICFFLYNCCKLKTSTYGFIHGHPW